MKMIQAVVFDLDGVLVDAVHWHYLALNKALKLFGFEIPPREHDAVYNGLPTYLKLQMLSQRKGLPTALHPIIKDLKQLYTREVIETSLQRDEKLLGILKHLKSKGYRIAVASNSVRETVEMMLKQMQVSEFFEVILSNEDVKNPKPNPEIYQKCFELLGIDPSEAMVIEDSPPGIQAARQSCPNVMVVEGTHDVTLENIEKNISGFNRHAETSASRREKETLEILIPMAGHGQRFASAGYKPPKPLIDVMGKPMIQWVVENIKPSNRPFHFTFLCQKAHLEQFELEKFLQEIAPGCSIVTVNEVTEGAACTALLAAQYINNDRPLLIANSDQWVDVDIDDFIAEAYKKGCDGQIMTFHATESKWSFARADALGRVTEVAEKKPISTHATTGIYFFRKGADFVKAATKMIRQNKRVNGEFYICPVYNELVEEDRKIYTYALQDNAMHGLGTPEDLQVFLKSPPKLFTSNA